jgi:hypothetical protein
VGIHLENNGAKKGGTAMSRNQSMTVLNPATLNSAENIDETPIYQIQQIYELSKSAFDTWKEKSVNERLSFIRKLKNVMLDRMDEIIEVIADDTGKVRSCHSGCYAGFGCDCFFRKDGGKKSWSAPGADAGRFPGKEKLHRIYGKRHCACHFTMELSASAVDGPDAECSYCRQFSYPETIRSYAVSRETH